MPYKPLLKPFLFHFKPSQTLLLCHENTDIDAMASALALYFSLPKKFHPTIGIPGHLNQSAEQLCNSLLENPIFATGKNGRILAFGPKSRGWRKKGSAKSPGARFIKTPDLSKFDAIMVLDFCSPSRAGPLQEPLQKTKMPLLVLDHHSKTKDSFRTRFSLLDPKASSTSFLVLQQLQQGRFSIPKNAWLALAAGMVSDSVDLSLADSVLLQSVAGCLQKTGFSIQEIRQLYAAPEDFSERIAKLKGLHRVQLFEMNGFLVALSHASFFESQIAMALLSAGADVSFVAGMEKKSDVCRMACRANLSILKKSKLNLAEDICIQLPRFFGGQGNGHSGAAGFAAFHAEPERVLHSSLELLTGFFRKKGKTVEFREII